jgi:hypothetical protein
MAEADQSKSHYGTLQLCIGFYQKQSNRGPQRLTGKPSIHRINQLRSEQNSDNLSSQLNKEQRRNQIDTTNKTVADLFVMDKK